MLDDRTRQRLVGAAVLVALAVIFLPMLLDGQPRQVERNVRLGLPERPALEGEGETIPLLNEQPKQAESSQQSPPMPLLDPDLNRPHTQPEPGGEGADLQAEGTDETIVLQPPQNSDAAQNQEQSRPEVKDQASPQTEPASPATMEAAETLQQTEPIAEPEVAKPMPRPAEPAVSNSQTPVQPAAQNPAGTSAGWWVQLGVFSKQANAQRLARQGKQAGFPCKTDAFLSGQRQLQRVWCGPFADRDAAEAERKRILSSLKLKEARVLQSGSLPEQAHARTDVAASLQGWAVQVGSFKGQSNADKLVQRLRKLDFPAYVAVLETTQSTRYRVRIGPYASKAEAEKQILKLSDRAGLPKGMLVKTP